jgi:DNA-binding response OmpR family regulator
MRLLIAEDDALFRNILQRILSPEHELIFVHDGHQAWAALQDPHVPRLAILDWVMPGLSGPQICRNVRACKRLSSMYLILFTARNSRADVTSGLRAGADDYITKPFAAAELRARVKLGENKLNWGDAVETQSILVSQALNRERRHCEDLRGRPFLWGQSAGPCLHPVQDRVIGPVTGVGATDPHCKLIATYPPRNSLEKLHA